jgi:hypothetical protein
MPTATLRRGDASTVSPPTRQRVGVSDDRLPLAKAIAAVEATEIDLIKLRDAADRVHTQSLQAWSAVGDRETTLSALRDRERHRAMRAYVDGNADQSPIPAAEQAVRDAQAEMARLEALEQSIAAEVAATEQRLRSQRSTLDQRIGELLANSEAIADLNRCLRGAWAGLRSLRATFEAINHAIPGSAPHRQLDGSPVEPIDPAVGYPVDDDLIAQWRDAVAALHDDAEAKLPGGDQC